MHEKSGDESRPLMNIFYLFTVIEMMEFLRNMRLLIGPVQRGYALGAYDPGELSLPLQQILRDGVDGSGTMRLERLNQLLSEAFLEDNAFMHLYGRVRSDGVSN
jgi:hypothetical protein